MIYQMGDLGEINIVYTCHFFVSYARDIEACNIVIVRQESIVQMKAPLTQSPSHECPTIKL